MKFATKIALVVITLTLIFAFPILLTNQEETSQSLKQKYDKIRIGDTIDEVQKTMKRVPDQPLQLNTQNDDTMIQENMISWRTTKTPKDSHSATLSIFVKEDKQQIHAKSYTTTNPNISREEHFLSLKHTIEGNYNGNVYEVIGDYPPL